MNIHAHILCWNEIQILPFVIRHYRLFCNKIYIYDNHSTDGSAEYAKAQGCEVIPFGDKTFSDQANMNLKNSCWKVSRGVADLVCVTDCDEILCNILGTPPSISKSRFTIYKTIGWQVMSEQMPVDSITEITNGYEFKNYAKSVIFDPNEIKEIAYGPGAHDCAPTGNVVVCDVPLVVLHYKHIGGVQRTIDRYKQCCKRLSRKNREMGWGWHNCQSASKLRREWTERMAKSRPLV